MEGVRDGREIGDPAGERGCHVEVGEGIGDALVGLPRGRRGSPDAAGGRDVKARNLFDPPKPSADNLPRVRGSRKGPRGGSGDHEGHRGPLRGGRHRQREAGGGNDGAADAAEPKMRQPAAGNWPEVSIADAKGCRGSPVSSRTQGNNVLGHKLPINADTLLDGRQQRLADAFERSESEGKRQSARLRTRAELEVQRGRHRGGHQMERQRGILWKRECHKGELPQRLRARREGDVAVNLV